MKAGTLNSSAKDEPAMKLVDKSAAKRNKSEYLGCIGLALLLVVGSSVE